MPASPRRRKSTRGLKAPYPFDLSQLLTEGLLALRSAQDGEELRIELLVALAQRVPLTAARERAHGAAGVGAALSAHPAGLLVGSLQEARLHTRREQFRTTLLRPMAHAHV